MTDFQRLESNIMSAMIQCGATPDHPIDLLVIGPGLVQMGFSQDDILNALLWMADDRRIELLSNNQVRPK